MTVALRALAGTVTTGAIHPVSLANYQRSGEREARRNLVDEFEKWMHQQGLAAKTIHLRRTQVERLIDHGDLTLGGVKDYCRSRDHSMGTRYLYAVSAKTYCEFRKRTTGEPSPWNGVALPKQPRGRPKPLTDEEVVRLRAVIPEDSHARDLVEIGLKSGLRASEIAGLKAEDLRDGEIHVCGKGDVVDSVPCHPDLERYFTGRGSLFPEIGGNNVSTLVGHYMRKAGIRGGVHRLRHTFGTRLYEATHDIYLVQKAMRHSTPAVTQVYAEIKRDRISTAIAGL